MAACNSELTSRSIQRQLQVMDRFLASYEWLLNSYTTDYFILQLNKKFPSSVETALRKCSFTDFASFLQVGPSGQTRDSNVLPLSMLCFRCVCQSLSISQDVTQVACSPQAQRSITPDKYLKTCVKAKKQHEIELLADIISSVCEEVSINHVVDVGAGLGHLSRQLSFNKKLKVTTIEAADAHTPKATRLDRQTEGLMVKKLGLDVKDVSAQRPNHISHWINADITIQQFTKLIESNSSIDNLTNSPLTDQDSPAQLIHDINNRMSTLLKQNAALSVCSDDVCTPNFNVPWSQIAVTDPAYLFKTGLATKQNGSCSGFVRNVAATNRTPCTGYVSQLPNSSHTETDSVCTSNSDVTVRNGVVLSGLHACGDLTPTMLRVFVSLPCAKAITSVACCYMKLSSSSRSRKQPVGFPMSVFVRHLPGHRHIATWESGEMACHFVHQYHERLLAGESSLKRHAYRAALQILMYKRKSKEELHHRKLKLKNYENMSFYEYVEKAFNRLGLIFDVTESEINECELLIQNHWRSIVGMYVLRLTLGPLLESYILMDRMLYLYEQGISSKLQAVFDPRISPRNFVLIATKDSTLPITSLNQLNI